ncbi:MAG: protein translocase subunit SecF [Candidatus Kapabacteria bacterium]|nr:protein translocase subunit SecF [Candidatus Kapabacteria bacterium]MBX7154651.1 protein translocase subunit SecF [Bacteroidota bacterium]
MEFFGKTNIQFLDKRKFFFYLSTAINIAGILIAVFLGVRYGIDFEGGTEVTARFKNPQQIENVRNAMDKGGFQNTEIKQYGKPTEFLIRVKEVTGTGEQSPANKIRVALTTKFPNDFIELPQTNVIGPKIGSELRTKAALAVFVAIVCILLYIAFRFEFVYGLGAVVSLIHDVCVAFTFVVIFQQLNVLNLEFNQGVLAALLTVVGFSINDTVIIFDRIRENREKHRGMSLITLMDLSINETLSRTINTVLTVVLVLITILALAGEALHGFAFTMLVGIITGTYSSIYVASAFVVWYIETVKKVDLETPHAKEIAKA